MKIMFGKKETGSPADTGRICRVCGLDLTDPLWRLCPRCRTETATCAGCSDCGLCRR